MSFTLNSIKHLSPYTLKNWILESHTGLGENFLVIDVRDSDFIGGHIKNAYNLPLNVLKNELDNLHNKLVDADINNVVFHCMLSQQRGPRAALLFGRYLQSSDISNINIYVLDGGFNNWQKLFKNEPELLENYQPDLW